MGLKAVVKTRAPADTDIDDEVEEIELPPREMWGELENGDVTHVAASITPLSTPAATPAPSAEVAKLSFVAGREATIGLDFPFIWEGRDVTEITVRRLTVGEVNDLLERVGTERIRTMDIFAIMCGLPTPVLRGLDDDDGRRVMEAATGFLPRVLRTAES